MPYMTFTGVEKDNPWSPWYKFRALQ